MEIELAQLVMSQDLMVFTFNIVSCIVKVLDTITTIHTPSLKF